jgi:hypothetical protein
LKLEYELPPRIAVSPEAHSLLAAMLVAQPEQRISIPQVGCCSAKHAATPSGPQCTLRRASQVQVQLRGSCVASVGEMYLFVFDPVKCRSVQIQRHPFFLRDLPPGVAEMNDRLVPPGAPSIKSFCMPEGVQACPC